MSGCNSKRNAQLVDDRNNGMTFKELSEKYGITNTRAQQIYKKNEAWKSLYKNPLYMRLMDSCWTLGFSPSCATRAYHAITKCYGYYKGQVVDCRTVEGLRAALDIPEFDVGGIRNIGTKSKKLILHAFGRDLREEA